MTLRIHAPNPIRVGETANVLVTSDNPGVVSLTYGAGLTGPASVTIEGTRVWRIGNRGGDYLAYPGVHQTRHECTWLLEVDIAKIAVASQQASAYDYSLIAQSVNVATPRRINWGIEIDIYNQTHPNYRVICRFFRSVDSSSNEAMMNGPAGTTYTAAQVVRFAIIYSNVAPKSGVYIYHGSRANVAATGAAAPVGTMGGTEVFQLGCARQIGRWDGVMSDGNLDAWFSSGTKPADPAFLYEGGHEIDSSVQKIYDSSASAIDLYNYSVFSPAAAVGDYTDDPLNPVVPYAIVPVTAVATTGTTIDATRPRQGVPPRASEAERIETAAQVTITVEAPLVSIGPDTDATVEAYPADVYLQVCAQPDGTVSLASDDANLAVPATVEIVGGSATVTATALADVTGAIITVTYGATTDDATVSVTEAAAPAETLVIGPDIDTEVESYPDAIILLLTSNVDGDVEIVSDDPNLIPMSPVTVIDGQAEVACLVTADVTGATVTASRDPGPSDSCSVTVSDVLTGDWIAVGPNQRTRIEGKRIVWPIRVRSSKDGAFIATASPEAGIIVSGPFELSGGACDITAQPTQAGSWVLTVEQDGRMDSVTLEALTPVAASTVRQYNLSAEIDAFFDSINRKYGFRPRFTPANVQDVRAEHATDRTYSRYAQGTGQPGSVFGAVALSYQVMISYSSATMAEQDLGILREEADRYGWNAIGFSMTGQTMFEPVKMMPRLTLTMNFDIIPQGR